jgi:hypothetical protein
VAAEGFELVDHGGVEQAVPAVLGEAPGEQREASPVLGLGSAPRASEHARMVMACESVAGDLLRRVHEPSSTI